MQRQCFDNAAAFTGLCLFIGMILYFGIFPYSFSISGGVVVETIGAGLVCSLIAFVLSVLTAAVGRSAADDI